MHHINENMFATGNYPSFANSMISHTISDFLASVAAFGVAISSGITLVVSVASIDHQFALKPSCRYSSLDLSKAKLLYEMKQKKESVVGEVAPKLTRLKAFMLHDGTPTSLLLPPSPNHISTNMNHIIYHTMLVVTIKTTRNEMWEIYRFRRQMNLQKEILPCATS